MQLITKRAHAQLGRFEPAIKTPEGTSYRKFYLLNGMVSQLILFEKPQSYQPRTNSAGLPPEHFRQRIHRFTGPEGGHKPVFFISSPLFVSRWVLFSNP